MPSSRSGQVWTGFRYRLTYDAPGLTKAKKSCALASGRVSVVEVVDRADDEPVAVGVDDRPEPRLDRAEVGHQYAASLRIPSAIFSGLTMNQSSRTWL